MPKPAGNKDVSGLQISWMTVSYRSVLLMIALFVLIVAGAMYVVFPSFTSNVATKSGRALYGWVDRLVGNPTVTDHKPSSQQAHFTNLDGTVRIKRSTDSTWVPASYSVALDKGDFIQTGTEGMAKVSFADGTSYTVKPDSLIQVQENTTNSSGQTQVVVDVPTGTVDLSTGRFTEGSKSQVIFAQTTANLTPDTTATLVTDSKHEQHELVLKQGAAEVRRNGESLQLTKNEKISFQGENSPMLKEKEILPPILIAPPNQLPVALGPDGNTHFAWAPAEEAKSYHLIISKSPILNPILEQKDVTTTNTTVGDLADGTYYWSVRSLGPNGKQSVESDIRKFTIVPKTQEASLPLSLDDFISHGHTVEVRGKTEPNARVLVNGEEVPVVDEEGKFTYFTHPLPQGTSVITITAENSQGHMTTQTRTVEIP